MAQQTFSTLDNVWIQIRACRDRVVILGTEDAHTVVVDRPARQEGNTIIVESEDRVTVRAPKSAQVSIVDCEADVRIDDIAGNVELSRVHGDVGLHGLRGETVVRDLEGDLTARSVASIRGEGTWNGDAALRGVDLVQADDVKGDVALGSVGRVTIRTLDGDLSARGVHGPLTLEEVQGDASLHGLDGPVSVAHDGGDLIVSGARDRVDAADVGGDAIVSLDAIAGMSVHAKGDVVVSLPVDANAALELDAPRGNVRARVPIRQAERDETHLSGTLGKGGPKVQAESTHGDVIVRIAGPGEPVRHWQCCGENFADMGERIAAQVEQSVGESLGGFHMHGGRPHGFGFGFSHRWPRAYTSESVREEKPKGPAAGSPERKAILDAIARGELSVDEAIRKLTGEE